MNVLFVRCRCGRVSAAIDPASPDYAAAPSTCPGCGQPPRDVRLATAADAPTGATIAGIALSRDAWPALTKKNELCSCDENVLEPSPFYER